MTEWIETSRRIDMAQPRLNPDGVLTLRALRPYTPPRARRVGAALATNPYRGCATGAPIATCRPERPRASIPMSKLMAGSAQWQISPAPNSTPARSLKPGSRAARKGRAQVSSPGRHRAGAAVFQHRSLPSGRHDADAPGDRDSAKPRARRFQVLTKGGSRTLRDIDLFCPDRDAFAASLTSLDTASRANGSAPPPIRTTASRDAARLPRARDLHPGFAGADA